MRKSKIWGVITAAGVLLIFGAAVLLLWNITSSKQAARQNDDAVSKILSLLPDRANGAPVGRAGTAMPVMEIGGQDYICLIEVPGSDDCLPVLSEKSASRTSAAPYRYSGAVSDGPLVIGGISAEFISCIEEGGTVTLTDMNGNRCAYAVTGAEQASKISEALFSGDDDLVLFSANKWSFDHTVVRCRLMQ